MSEALALYDSACAALAKAKSVDEAKGWCDKAAAVRAYARQAKNRSLEIDAAEIRMRAERRLGEILAAQKALPREQGGGMNRGRAGSIAVPKENRNPDPTPTLAELGIDKKLSSRAQKLAAVPEPKFEKRVADWRERAERGSALVASDTLTVMEPSPRPAPMAQVRRRPREMASDVAWRELWDWRNRNRNLAIFRPVFDAVDELRPQFKGAVE